jgi:hypothetical protein
MRRRLIGIGATLVAAAALAIGGTAWATAGDEADESVTGPGAERARAAALAEVGGGRTVEVERESESGSAWQVEIVQPDGPMLEVLLDDDYRVIAVETESEGDDGTDDD